MLFGFLIAMSFTECARPPAKPPETDAEVIAQQQKARRCWEATMPPPEAYNLPIDQERARKNGLPCTRVDLGRGCRMEGPGMMRLPPCERTVPKENAVTSLDVDACFRMSAPTEISGVWLNDFEGSVLKSANIPDLQGHDVWLTWKQQPSLKGRQQGRRYRITFIGRYTPYDGHYGHFGMSYREVIVDRLLSIEPIK